MYMLIARIYSKWPNDINSNNRWYILDYEQSQK